MATILKFWERNALQPGTWGYTIFVLLLGAVVGTLLGQVAASYGVKILGQSISSLSLAPTTLDLRAFTLTLGFSLKMNLMGLIGLLAGFIYVRRTS
ncbi:MAG: DUF4321 domain-containing protein [Firmicutes bacterium]|nr:DUF4321 domain-containing protein [Bacillota bacterium]